MMNWNSALALSTALRDGTFSAVDVMNETYDRIEKHNPRLNAIVNLLSREEALKLAHAADHDVAGAGGDEIDRILPSAGFDTRGIGRDGIGDSFNGFGFAPQHVGDCGYGFFSFHGEIVLTVRIGLGSCHRPV